jgi:hypothetical protein
VGAPGAKADKAATAPSAKKRVAKVKPTPVKASPASPKTLAKVPAKTGAKPQAKGTLAATIQHVLETRQRANAGGVKARQLYEEVQQAGYQFGGNSVGNSMNYLRKTLRQHRGRFKRAADGTLSLARKEK